MTLPTEKAHGEHENHGKRVTENTELELVIVGGVRGVFVFLKLRELEQNIFGVKNT